MPLASLFLSALGYSRDDEYGVDSDGREPGDGHLVIENDMLLHWQDERQELLARCERADEELRQLQMWMEEERQRLTQERQLAQKELRRSSTHAEEEKQQLSGRCERCGRDSPQFVDTA